ncbi:hypothetical protein HMPREF1051_2889 [Neisseria sicca VK64]|uniref:Uncharacterized protein n=1 Tax=Neisseria sicca VK64 TaxID=1095748 RepID=I2NWU0_NEISI|nr:hypothetical protein HMPREF1051_2889 [Neisseria sicca VK64]
MVENVLYLFRGLWRTAAIFCQPENHAPIIRWEHGQTKVV